MHLHGGLSMDNCLWSGTHGQDSGAIPFGTSIKERSFRHPPLGLIPSATSGHVSRGEELNSRLHDQRLSLGTVVNRL